MKHSDSLLLGGIALVGALLGAAPAARAQVGVGTTSPASAFHLYSSNNPTVLRIHSSAGFGSTGLDFYSDPQGSANEWRPAFVRTLDAGSFTGGLAFYTNGTGVASRTGTLEGMRLVNGRLGIGTTTPDSRLDVDGTLTVSGGNANEINRAQTGTSNLVPICYGNIDDAGGIRTVGSTANFTVSHVAGSGIYDIIIAATTYYYLDYTTLTTLNDGSPGFVTINSINGSQLRVFTYGINGVTVDRPFNFVIYKP